MAKKKKRKQISTHLPEEYLERLEGFFGARFARIVEETSVERPTTFRANTMKINRTEVLEELKRAGIKTKLVSWDKDSMILANKTKRDLTDTRLYEEGKIYLQSLASMAPPLVMDPQPGQTILDLTAAPGSKTSQIAALMQMHGTLVANEKNKPRFFKLKHNMEHLGIVVDGEDGDWNFVLRLEDGRGLSKEYPDHFDQILLDAPCSSEARFVAGKPKTFGYWKKRKIKEMAYMQRQLLEAAWAMLKPGGQLVYSTCTFAPEENEVQISKFLHRHEDASLEPARIKGLTRGPILSSWKENPLSDQLEHALRIMPTKEVEGFFVAKVRKQ